MSRQRWRLACLQFKSQMGSGGRGLCPAELDLVRRKRIVSSGFREVARRDEEEEDGGGHEPRWSKQQLFDHETGYEQHTLVENPAHHFSQLAIEVVGIHGVGTSYIF
ncbi:hypothetical protein L2E82_19788 [Cichorium intybus]|uniref:Uncharacterized protein n=1 Tax=Cichorium intybus TaxID=13427 RepID=A0ACB9DRW1_CICIN|nr:hypothetical protein L2E82_19788 [Cichorium intybus]